MVHPSTPPLWFSRMWLRALDWVLLSEVAGQVLVGVWLGYGLACWDNEKPISPEMRPTESASELRDHLLGSTSM